MKLEQIAITDYLTKVYNRRFFFEIVEKEIERAKRNRTALSIVMIDIDNFKAVNDSYGHLVGDQVLINLANTCQESIRSMDLFARFGGEEYVILMPETEVELARETAERLRCIVAEKPLLAIGDTEIWVTISLGVASWDAEHSIAIETLIDHADQALYESKAAGRNRVTVWRDADPE